LGWSTAGARPFRAGLAAVRFGGPDFGFLDRTGRVVIAATYAGAGEFSPDGLAPVRVHDAQVTLRPDGSPAPVELSHLSEGLDVFSSGGLAGYRHAAGEIVIPARFAEAWPFSEGLAAVAVAGCRERCIGFVDHAGRLVVPPRFDVHHDAPAPRFSEGRAAVFVGDQVGFVDRSGRWVVSPRYSAARAFREGRAAVQRDHRWGFVSLDGEEIVPPRFRRVDGFSDGRALVEDDGAKVGFIDRSGHVAVALDYAWGSHFEHGVACVGAAGDDPPGEDLAQSIDANGKVLWTSAARFCRDDDREALFRASCE
jgi:hypothetical protein